MTSFRRAFAVMLTTIVLLALAACAAPRSSGGPAQDYTGLLNALRSAGASVAEAGSIAQPFLSVPGRLIALESEQVQVYEYADTGAAADQAAKVSADGTEINGGTYVDWIKPVHWYESGRLLVIYVGADPRTLDLLSKSVGQQFAGA